MESRSDGKSSKLEDEATEHPTPKEASKRSTSPSTFRKPCDLCHEPNDVLVRCQIDETATWHFVCPKRCWKDVSGGLIDGSLDHPYYKYGGMDSGYSPERTTTDNGEHHKWKNKHALVSAKKRKFKKQDGVGGVKG